MSNLDASREETFTRLFHVVAKKYRVSYRSTPDLIGPAGKAFLASINYGEDEFIAFVKDFVGTVEETFERNRSLAEQHDVIAQSALGYMYANGLGSAHDNVQAAFWYRRAAEKGDVTAQNALGYMYANGLGVTQDYIQAAIWYRKAAEQKDINALSGLGYLYTTGLGLDQDYIQAAHWHCQAAELGSDYSQLCLGMQYQYGQGVAQDLTQAAFWFRQAAEQGNISAIEALKNMGATP
jgi:TPR repeat protein